MRRINCWRTSYVAVSAHALQPPTCRDDYMLDISTKPPRWPLLPQATPLLLQCLKRCEERCLTMGALEATRSRAASPAFVRGCCARVCTVSPPESECWTSICERAQIPPYLRHAWPLILNGDKCCAGSNWGNEKNHFSLPTDQWVPIQLESLKPLAPG